MKGAVCPMDPLLGQYKVLVEFLGKALGSDYEVALHDLSDGRNTIIAIANGHVSGREVGAPLTNFALRMIAGREYEKHDYMVGYQGTSGDDVHLQSSTMFIKNNQGKLIGLLCINFDPSRCVNVVNSILNLCGLPSISLKCKDKNDVGATTENFVGSVPDAVKNAIKDVTGNEAIPANRLTMDEKIRIVDALNQTGLFYLKGAVNEVAAQLGSSEATIYRYLSKLRS